MSRLRTLRSKLAVKVSWVTIFTKAFALAAREIPELRRTFLRVPYERLYESRFSVASIAVQRDFAGEPAVFFAQLKHPAETPLAELDAKLLAFQREPVETAFRLQLLFFRFPKLLRRMIWWYLINVRGRWKAQFLGTFGVSVYSGQGAESLHPISPLTFLMNYGVIAPDGHVAVRIVYDHRVLDGSTLARALARIDEILQNEIVSELEYLLQPNDILKLPMLSA